MYECFPHLKLSTPAEINATRLHRRHPMPPRPRRDVPRERQRARHAPINPPCAICSSPILAAPATVPATTMQRATRCTLLAALQQHAPSRMLACSMQELNPTLRADPLAMTAGQISPHLSRLVPRLTQCCTFHCALLLTPLLLTPLLWPRLWPCARPAARDCKAVLRGGCLPAGLALAALAAIPR